MGSFARVALPVAAAVIAPQALAALGPANTAAGLIASEGIVPGVTTFLSGATVPAAAALVPAATPLSIAKAGISGLLDLDSRRQAEAQQAFAQARNQAEAARLLGEFQVGETRRRAALRRAVAAERARLGGSGLSSVGGSGAALIRGLQTEAEEDIRLDRERTGLRRRDLLDASQPRARSGFGLVRNTLSPFVNLLD